MSYTITVVEKLTGHLGAKMKRSTDRILTTHVGSMPRSDELCDVLLKKEREEDHDLEVFADTVRRGVNEIVSKQAEIGIDIVSDGEASKIGYATYIKDRFTGFGGNFKSKPHRDLADHPKYREMLGRLRGPALFRRTCCVGPIELKDEQAIRDDLDNFASALETVSVEGAFLNAASPGVVSAFQPNEYYDDHEAYVRAIGEAMRSEYEAIAEAGYLLQVDCPDLAMSRHTGFQDLTDAEFARRTDLHVEVLNEALRNIPRDQVRVHLCWGNYEGPHDFDIPLNDVIDRVLRVEADAISFEASNPRHGHEWTIWRDKCADLDIVLMPGMLDTSTNYVEHPELVAERIVRFAECVGKERVIASTDCGFGTFVGSVAVEETIAYKKLGSLVEGARIASERLY